MRGAGRPLFTVTLVPAVAVHASAQENVTPRTAQSTTDGRQAKSASPTPGGGQTVPVTADNFVRAESDLYFTGVVKDGGFGKFRAAGALIASRLDNTLARLHKTHLGVTE
jgi:hypothetical protein